MNYRLELETRAKKEFLKLPARTREAIAEALDELQKDPRPPGSKKLLGQDGYRIRKGNYRILYTISDNSKLIRVYRAGHRRDVYR